MPELPDLTVYLDGLRRVAVGTALDELDILNPFVLRSVDPSPGDLAGRKLRDVSRIGKRIVLEFSGQRFAVMHLMVAGRLRWVPTSTRLAKRGPLAVFRFLKNQLVFSEAGSKRRASLYLVRGRDLLVDHDPGGLEVLGSDHAAFRAAIQRQRHTLKRALTDPRIVSGVGNAYSDEILHRARLSPFKLSDSLSESESERLHEAAVAVLEEWIKRLRQEVGDGFPDKVTAFRPEMAVHGRFDQPCPQCGAPVQRIRYASKEANYCAGCQTGGRIFADRSLSRLLKADWPKTLDDLESKMRRS